MKILAIETSCDETAISVVVGTGEIDRPSFTVLSHLISSQAELHAKWGGVVPSLAKREHAKNITPLLKEALTESNLAKEEENILTPDQKENLKELFVREENLAEQLISYIESIATPDIDAIAVTFGPGLEPALWVGINFAKALALIWQKPLIPINHMEGHVVSPLLEAKESIKFPAIALLVSGGHTEIVLCRNWFDYEIIGQTRDDAVGEAFDKVARLLDLPYPGGPQISLWAQKEAEKLVDLPRPMINTPDYDFSFSGLKTAVLYAVRDKELTDKQKAGVAKEFQEAVVEVLIKKTFKAIADHGAQSLIVGGGVIANQTLRETIEKMKGEGFADLNIFLPENKVITDNATMIAMAAYLRHQAGPISQAGEIKADGNAKIDKIDP